MSRWSKRKKKKQSSSEPLESREERYKVVVVTPVNDFCHAHYCASLIHMACHTLTSAPFYVELHFLQAGTSILPFSRQIMVQRSLEVDADWILTIDSDMKFPADTLLRLLRHGKSIVGVNCMARRPPHHSTAQTEDRSEIVTTEDSSGIEKAGRLGFGLVLLQAKIFREMELPWFEFEWLPDKKVFRGEDYVFFDKVRKAGYELYVDHDLSKEVKHLGQFEYSPLLRPPGG